MRKRTFFSRYSGISFFRRSISSFFLYGSALGCFFAITLLYSLPTAVAGSPGDQISPKSLTQTKEEVRRLHCLNNICPGDKYPDYDRATQMIFKRGGKWFVGPKAYGAYNGSFAFYWPSKTPMTGRPDKADYPERAAVRAGKFFEVAIEFFIEAKEQQGEMYGLIKKAQDQGNVEKVVQLRKGLEAVYRKRSPKLTFDEPVLFVATKQTTFAGVPPVVSCYIDDNAPSDICTAGFYWKPGLRVYVRFNRRHAEDWPEIFSEITRVLNLVKGGE